jgi:putative SOS response-associated peptidase YedK
MCGRYSCVGNLDELAKLVTFISRVPFFAPRYNIAPRQQAPVIVRANGQTEAKLMRWGLIPSWSKDESIGDKLINARAETLTEKTSFKKPFASQRCLVPADGFYEWQRSEHGGKTPFRFTMKDGGFFCFAGLWEKWIRPPKEQEFLIDDVGDVPQPSRVVETFTIITTTPNKMAAAIHDRMPAIIGPEHFDWWLDEDGKSDFLKGLLGPYPAEGMDCYRVSPLVNNAKNDSPECLKPA